MILLELYSGSGIVSRAFQQAGWDTILVDNNINVGPTVVADVRHLPMKPMEIDFIWASPPCTEFSYANTNSPYKTSTPDLSNIKAIDRLVREYPPKRGYIIENVLGAQRWLGKPDWRCGSICLWGVFPEFETFHHVKNVHTVRGLDVRAMIPWSVPYRLAMALNKLADCKS